MRVFAALLAVVIGWSSEAGAQSCTGLCLQQVSCTAGATTSLTGTVYAPNGQDPLPNVTVYIPNAAVSAFTPGVSCPAIGQPPPGSPLVGTTTGADGTFTLTNVPVGSNIPLVIQSGRWRRQLVIPGTTACTGTALPSGFARMPRNKTEGDIPKIAIATGSADPVECVLRKVGVDDSEFTDPSGTGRINVYLAGNSPGAKVDTATPAESSLMGDLANLNSYDVLMLPCEGNAYTKSATELSNLVSFANAGGRVYSSHFAYEWMYQNPPFNSVVNWDVKQAYPFSNGVTGTATVDTSFPDGATLAQWLQIVGATTTAGQITLNTLRHDFDGVIAPTQSWLTANDPSTGNPVMQFTFDTPVSTTAAKCGRVLFNEYHVESASVSPVGKLFPAECVAGTMTPQEKLLEYSLFDLTNEGGAPTLTPTSLDFGSEPLGFTTAAQNFVWKNNSVFAATVSSAAVTGDFRVTANTCGNVLSGGSCTIAVAFTPSTLGARTGALTVVSNGTTLTSTLTGTGVADLGLSVSSLDFGSVDVGASATRSVTLVNSTPASLGLQPFTASGDFAVSSNCGSALGASSSCTLSITFTPTMTGQRSGTLTVTPANPAYNGARASLTGNGVDFALALNPTSGSVIAGFGTTTSLAVTPIAGFSAPVTLACVSAAPASTCTLSTSSITPSSSAAAVVTLTTTAQYAVIGYGGLGLTGIGSLLALTSGGLLWTLCRRAVVLREACGRTSVLLAVLFAISFGMTGCGGKSPTQNGQYTAPGGYAVTITATDGFLKHSVTYTLNVTTK